MSTELGFGAADETGQHSQGGAEVLLLDGDVRVRSGFRKLLASAGVIVTAIDDREQALNFASEKHFAVAVLDLDTPEPDAGFEVMAEIKRRSPATKTVLLATRQTFAVAVSGFRQGAAEVIAKSPDNVSYLTNVVVRLCGETYEGETRGRVLTKTMELHEEFLKRLMEASRRAAQAEDKLAKAHDPNEHSECVVLVVDDNPNTAEGLRGGLPEGEYRVVGLQTGGEALDYAGRAPFQLALVKEGLPDLPSSMVAKSVRAETAEGIVLLFSHPVEGRPGRADIIELSQSIELLPELITGSQLVEQIHELRKAHSAKARERRYLQQFRSDHFDFLRRYVELRQEISQILPEPEASSVIDDD